MLSCLDVRISHDGSTLGFSEGICFCFRLNFVYKSINHFYVALLSAAGLHSEKLPNESLVNIYCFSFTKKRLLNKDHLTTNTDEFDNRACYSCVLCFLCR